MHHTDCSSDITVFQALQAWPTTCLPSKQVPLRTVIFASQAHLVVLSEGRVLKGYDNGSIPRNHWGHQIKCICTLFYYVIELIIREVNLIYRFIGV